MIVDVENVFIMGLGRSGLVAKAFGMRLMHLGLKVYIVGDTITPAITDKVISGVKTWALAGGQMAMTLLNTKPKDVENPPSQ